MSSLSNEPRRPRILPQNRKLRHLKGISLRNLSLVSTHLRTADDASIQTSSSLKPSPQDAVVAERPLLQTSRSSENLRHEVRKPNFELSPQKKQIPGKLRRASLSLAHRLPSVRQNKLEEAVEDSVGSVFFSLHVANEPEPVYVSEVKDRSANFNFQFFSLDSLGPVISRSCMVTVRLWARRPASPKWTYLLEELVDLRMLNFIGTLLDRRFPTNALVFHLEDGIYSLDFPSRIGDPKPSPLLLTSSYNALMKLANLESSIEDAMATQHKIISQINDIINSSEIVPNQSAQEKLVLAGKYVAAQQRLNKASEKYREDLAARLQTRRATMQEGRAFQEEAEQDIINNRDQLQHSREAVKGAERDIRGQRRRICSELSDMFPITPIPNAPALSFEICQIPIPNSVYDSATSRVINEDVLSAGLGLLTLLVYNLQFYLSCPLPYPLTPYGSRSYATDSISLLNANQHRRASVAKEPASSSHGQDFPLYLPKGGSISGQWRFEYGWFLLNKNIEALCSSQGLKVVDIRHTLPNLKYLLYVCSAGTEDVPERKKGGVRGLWAGRIKSRAGTLPVSQPLLLDGTGSEAGSLSGSRRGSVDSDEVLSQEALLRRRLGKEGKEDEEDAREEEGDGIVLPFGEDAKISLRTKGMRENRS